MRTCAFCHIARGESLARIIYQDAEVTAFHDRNPQAPTHVLIIPNKHIESVNQVGPADTHLLGKLLLVARQVAEEEGITNGYRLVVNTGPQAGQSVFHLHVHLLGGRRLGWPPG